MSRPRLSQQHWLALALWLGPLAGCATSSHPPHFTAVPYPRASGVATDVVPLGALHLHGEDKNGNEIGGFSSLWVSEEGDLFVAVSDTGYWWHGALDWDAAGHLVGVYDLWAAPMTAPDGGSIGGTAASKKDADAEAVVRTSDGWLVAFEQDHRVWQYDRIAGTSRAYATELPTTFRQMPSNGGIEAAEMLSDGSVLLVSEHDQESTNRLRGWRIQQDVVTELTLQVTEPFSPTDLARLPNGDLLVVERAFSEEEGVRVRLSRIAKADAQGSLALEPTPIMTLAAPYPLDNYEGAAAFARPDGRTVVLLVSDDNFSSSQRTLLLALLLPE